MRLARVLVDLHGQPRRLRAFGSLSRHFCAHQGILAGCNHATGVLFLLNFRAPERLNAIAPRVTPEALVRDASIQFTSDNPKNTDQLVIAVKAFTHDSRAQGLRAQVDKSGLVAGGGVARKWFRRAADQLGPP
eukprot:2916177-Pyramimonas_sp.AAC.1